MTMGWLTKSIFFFSFTSAQLIFQSFWNGGNAMINYMRLTKLNILVIYFFQFFLTFLSIEAVRALAGNIKIRASTKSIRIVLFYFTIFFHFVVVFFRKCDLNGDGHIDSNEFPNMMKTLYPQQNWTDDSLAEALKTVDSDGNGSIDFNELVAWYMGQKLYAQYVDGELK